MSTHTKKGTITLEAAIVLPLFIIAVLTIGVSMKVIHYQETAVFVAGNEANALAKNAAIMPVNFNFPIKLEGEIEEQLPELEDADVRWYFYKYSMDGIDNLISFEVALKSNSRLPGNMTGDYQTKHAFLLRGFCGKDNSKTAMYEYAADDGVIVYVLPEYGEKYHKEDCRHVTPHPVQTIMNDNIRKKYKACGNCKPQGLKNGTVVYCFKYGDAYHTGECSSVEKHAVTMTKGDARQNGYIACLTCGGS